MRKRNKRKKYIVIVVILVLLVLSSVIAINIIIQNRNEKREAQKISEITEHYSTYVITSEESIIYNAAKESAGRLGKNVELVLAEEDITADTEYFKIINLDEEYYIKYNDVEVLEELSTYDNRYKSYIVFNQNIVTTDSTSFYDEKGNLVYEFNKSYELPIIIKENEKYGVEFEERLLYVLSDDVVEIKDSNNTEQTNSSGVGVLNYHAFYDETNDEERASCTTEICHSLKQFKTHLDFFKENNILTIKMNELEMYIDGKIQLPKSVLMTIDDGPKTEHAVDLLGEYKMYATIFLVTSWFDEETYYKNEYIELHSHTHNMHDGGQCPGGQGGGIKCLSEETIQNDLSQSRQELNNTTALAYPFYEYNDYSIRMLKEAGFTMAFIGESYSSDNLVHVGSDKFRLRRFIIVTYTTMNDLKRYFGQIR